MRKLLLACAFGVLSSAAFSLQLVKDVNTVPRDGLTGGSNFTHAVQTTGRVIFLGQDVDHGFEPWVTDGTPAGTRLLKDIFAGPSSSEIDKLTLVNGVAFFRANDGINGIEIWRSDGTPAGTRIVANIGPGSASGVADLIGTGPFPAIGNIMYFYANDGSTGTELWRTDGTSAGTYRLTDGVAGAVGIHPMDFHVVGNRLYFLATDAESQGLWTSDGTVSGSRRVVTTNLTNNRPIGKLQALGDVLYFTAGIQNAGGIELWRANAAGEAERVTSLVPAGSNSGTGFIGLSNNRLFFTATTNAGYGLFSITATSNTPTVLEQPLSTGVEMQDVVQAPGGLLIQFRDTLTGYLYPLYMSDGTVAGTGFVNSELRLFYGEPMTARDENWVYFYGREGLGAPGNIYRSGGSVATTSLYATIDNPTPLELEAVGGRLYFMNGRFNDPVHGSEVWTTDGTPLGTQRISDLAPDSGNTRAELEAVGGRLYLSVFDGIASFDPWSTDGVAAPIQLAELGSGVDTRNSAPAMLGTAGALVLFAADDGVNGTELWSTNGTSIGTRMLTNFSGGNGMDVGSGFVQMNGFGLFVGNGAFGVAGTELWRSDGTAAGTTLIANIAPRLVNAVVIDEVAYFIASDNVHGVEVWRSDGTSAGTAMVFDAVPGAADGVAHLFQATSNGRFLIRGMGLTSSFPTIYSSDGTEAGTVIASNAANVTSDAFALQDRVCVNVYIVNAATSEYYCADGTPGNFTQLTDFQGMGLTPTSKPYVVNGVVLLSCLVTGGGWSSGGIYVLDGSGAPPVQISNLHFSQGVYLDGGARFAFVSDAPGGDIAVTDGTAIGTRSLLAGTSAQGRQLYGRLAGVNDSVVFGVRDATIGPVVWKSDGTAAGTRFLFDTDPAGATADTAPSEYLQHGDRVYLSAYHGGTGSEPWYFSVTAPSATDDFAETNFGTTIVVPVAANDADFDSSLSTPTVEITTPPLHGVATVGPGTISYTPSPGFSGLDRLVYRVLDSQGNASNGAYLSVTTLGDPTSPGPGTAPAPSSPPANPPSGGGGGGSSGGGSSGGGGGGAFGWELLLLMGLMRRRMPGVRFCAAQKSLR